MDDQIKQLVERLALLEKEVATLKVQAELVRLHYATKVDLINAGVPVAIIEANYATKEDVAKLRGDFVARR
jgi:hypothetical protein